MTRKKLFWMGATTLLLSYILVYSLTSCGRKDARISGQVEGGAGTTIVLERPDFVGRWIALDSATLSKKGGFSMEIPRPVAPEVYRLRIGERFVYFPVDSTESLTLKAQLSTFGTGHTLEGTPQAAQMARFDTETAGIENLSADSLTRLKRRVYAEIIQPGKASILSYYVLTKTVGDHFLFDPTNQADMPYYNAVATAYKQYKPDDPHTLLLEQTALEGQRRRNAALGKQHVLEAEEVAFFEVEGSDVSGQTRKLSETLGNGKPTLLVFTTLTHENSPQLNRELASIASRCSSGLDIFMVCYDEDLYAWRDAARNLPWTVVVDTKGGSSPALLNYAIESLPTFFILDKNGELAARPASISDIYPTLSKHL